MQQTNRPTLANHVFDVAAALSLLVAATIAVLWVRSYWRDEGVSREGGKTTQAITSSDGRLMYSMRAGFERGPVHWRFYSAPRVPYTPMVPPTTWYGRLHFSYANERWNAGAGWPVHDVRVSVPHWSGVICFLVLPLWRAFAWRSRRRKSTRGFEVGEMPDT